MRKGYFGLICQLTPRFREYDGMNRPHRLICMKAWSVGRSTIRSCGLVGGGVSQGMDLEISRLTTFPVRSLCPQPEV